jgi:hypothetical protein
MEISQAPSMYEETQTPRATKDEKTPTTGEIVIPGS